jgi:TIR domain
MADIFISYSRPNRALTERLAKALESMGFTVWWDAEIVGGEEFKHEILEALRQARAAIIVWTKASLESDWVKYEAGRADQLGMLIRSTAMTST